ncbi:SUMF1/EgtB/PvdO family nonheme iron enzyme [Euzebya tangerina]|uniref:SUMF1/EgtB/PvdO family nonheme iron enzyme n=1 Tax=Euzebya tangerina TaxID=591198 RepID=UPI000E310B15|nr:SUMF1/EgtB/PvdO family nonheme iron enzyme [Euzebya tangerina]
MTATDIHPLRRHLRQQLHAGRQWTFTLLDPLDDEEMARQPHRIMSPLVWDLGHIGNFEELWLLRGLGDHSLSDQRLDTVYNPFDNPRWTRADLPLLPRREATEYIAEVRGRALDLMADADLVDGDPLVRDGFVYHMVAQHEAQHQETMLQALDLRGETHGDDAEELADADDPRLRIYLPATRRVLRSARQVDDLQTVVVPAGPFALGAPDPADLAPSAPRAARDAAVAAYDNERPRRTVSVPGFAIDVFPVTARRFAAFVADHGYRNPDWWSERGREWLKTEGHTAPQGWYQTADGEWAIRRFNRVSALDPRELVEHVTFWEAEAFAAWAGGRLPTEVEWEKAAAHDPATGSSRPYPWGDVAPTPDLANIDRTLWGPSLVGSYPDGASAYGVEHLLGDSYEWTSSDFEPYPGYRTFPYPEYSEVFFGGDWKVLRGASWATRASVARSTFRNWDHPYRRQIFSGVRVAYDLRDGRPVRPQVR